ncbi:MAG: hypothetical protein WCZ11_02035 [Bacilli bacterium]
MKDPIRPITYDIVSNPSHENAKVLEFLPESASEYITDGNVICEGEFVDLLSKDQIAIQEGDSVIVRFINDIINERFNSVISKGIKFKL